MDKKQIQSDVKNYKVREGPIYKRSKFLKEWRDRWLVLTHNYLYTFTSKKLDQVTDILDLRDFKSYKSYLRKDQQMIPAGFKIRTTDDMFYFCAKSCNEKWSWIVTFQRLLDYKNVGATPYNNVDFIKTKGFQSQLDFQNGGKVQAQTPPPVQVVADKTEAQAKKQVDEEAEKIMKRLASQQEELERQKEQLNKKEANFLQEQQRKRREEEERKKEEEKKIKTQPPPPQPPKEQEKREVGGSKVAQLKNMFESKMTEKSSIPSYDTAKYEQKKAQKKKQFPIGTSRSNIVVGLFDEFRAQASESFGFKYMIDFLVNTAGDERLGYSQFVIREGKNHMNRQIFAQIFIELMMVFNNYEECENLMRFIETCIFQIPGLFSQAQIALIQRKLKEYFNVLNNEAKLELVIKNMFIMHKMKPYQKDEIFTKLDKLVKEVKREETRNWSKKLRDDL